MRHLVSIQSVTHKYRLQNFYLSAKKFWNESGEIIKRLKKERAGSGGEGRGEIQQLMRPQTIVH